MGNEVTYDNASSAELISPKESSDGPQTIHGGDTQDIGCHSNSTQLSALSNNKNAEILKKYEKDYPVGPHDKPQSMCPAFGSLRVGLRMKRVATVLSGSACCVYGLSFVSHFYGARRSVGYVPFNSESLVTGKLFEDIRDAVHDMADPKNYDAIVVTNLCVPTASGVPLRLLPNEINGVRIIGIDVPGFGVPTHAEAKDILAGAMLNFSRQEVEAGPVAAPSSGKSDRPTLAMLGEMFPADPMVIGSILAPMDLAAGPVLPAREWREMYAALDCSAVAAIHPFYTATMREFDAAGRPSIGSAPVGYEGTASWLESVGEVFGVSKAKVSKAKNAVLPNIKKSIKDNKIKGRITVSGYEGSELIVARLLSESGIDVPYAGTACPRTPMAEQDAQWLEAKGAVVKFRASLEDDISAAEALEPELAIGTTPLVQHFKQKGKSALYFTNLVSARPLMGQAGVGSFNQLINGVLNNSEKMQSLQNFFEGVGSDDTSGVWEGEPNLRPEFRAQNQKKLEKAARAAKAAEMI